MHRYRGAVSQPFAYASLLTAARHAAPAAIHVKLLAASPAAAARSAPGAGRTGLPHRAPEPALRRGARRPGGRGQTCSLPFRDPDALASALLH